MVKRFNPFFCMKLYAATAARCGAAGQNFTQAQNSLTEELHNKSTLLCKRRDGPGDARKEISMTRLKSTQRLACTALAAALAGLAVPAMAQPAAGAGPATEQAQRPRMRAMTPEQRQQFMLQRAEAFKQKLQLTPAQEPAWNSFMQAMRPDAGSRQARLDLQGMDKLTTPERIDRMRALHAQHTAEMDRRGDAVKAFYATLTPAQQKTFDAEGTRMYGQRGAYWGGRKGEQMGDWHGGRHGMRHHGWGPSAA